MTYSCFSNFYDKTVPTSLIDQVTSMMNGCEKFDIVNIGDATSHFFKVTNAP
jgi:hypothetical protein